MRLNLEQSEDSLQAYARKNDLIYTADKQNFSEEMLRQLQSELSQARADRVAKQSRYEVARSAAPETLADVVNDGNLRALQANLVDLRRQQAQLDALYKPDYSKVKKVLAQIPMLESTLERERKIIVDRIANDFQEAKRREDLLTSVYGGQVQVVSQDLEKSIQYNILSREVDTSRQTYESVLQLVKESSIVSALRASNVRVIDPARPPEKPRKPSVVLNGGVGLSCGLLFGVVLVIMRHRSDRTLQHPGDAAIALGLRELGVIPRVESAKPRRSGSLVFAATPNFRIRCRVPGLQGRVANGRKLTKLSMQLATWQNQGSFVAGSFLAVLTSVLHSSGNGVRPRVLVITSAEAGEGKTTAASNLAIAMAQTKDRVLLIDGDLHKPHMHEIFDLGNEAGLADLLNQSSFDESLAAALVEMTAIPGLDVLTSGPSGAAGSNLLFSRSLGGLGVWCRKQYDMVIIDTPPILAMPDARLVGRLSDAVLLVTRAGSTTREAALAACQRLAEDGTPLLGVILNDWNPRNSLNGYYSYKGRHHYRQNGL